MPSVAVRTGDTPAIERARFQREPADILITTPESLYLLLTSNAREALRTIDTVIVDEIHAWCRPSRRALASPRASQCSDGGGAAHPPLSHQGPDESPASGVATDQPASVKPRSADYRIQNLGQRQSRPRSIPRTRFREFSADRGGASIATSHSWTRRRKKKPRSRSKPLEDMRGWASQEIRAAVTERRPRVDWERDHPRCFELVRAHASSSSSTSAASPSGLASALNESAGEPWCALTTRARRAARIRWTS